jgi:hypothetical protein
MIVILSQSEFIEKDEEDMLDFWLKSQEAMQEKSQHLCSAVHKPTSCYCL